MKTFSEELQQAHFRYAQRDHHVVDLVKRADDRIAQLEAENAQLKAAKNLE